jgi:hypothetical protein
VAALGVDDEAVLALFSAALSFAAGFSGTSFTLALTDFLSAESVGVALASPINEAPALT